jgi:hypothetical protein
MTANSAQAKNTLVFLPKGAVPVKMTRRVPPCRGALQNPVPAADMRPQGEAVLDEA